MWLVVSMLLFNFARHQRVNIDASHVRLVSFRWHARLRRHDVALSISRYNFSRMKLDFDLFIYLYLSNSLPIYLYLSKSNWINKYPTTPKTHISSTTTSTIANSFTNFTPSINQHKFSEPGAAPSQVCEDEDIGGPNCPLYTGPIAVYRFSLAMILFFFIFMLLTVGVSTSRSTRGLIHNGLGLSD